jgi:Na+-translocating ferredoxin:NAD+ oxidoreductase RnfG subunit
MTRMTLGVHLMTLGLLSAMTLGCAEETVTGEQRVHIVKNNEAAPEVGGIAPDKQADIQLMLQQREPSVRKCYNDVLNDGSHDRTFKGIIVLLISLASGGRVTGVKVINDTLKNNEVSSCVVDKLKEFEYPDIPNPGTMQYSYKFEPAY